MTPLRQRLIEEIALRGYSDKTQEAYVHAVACLARHYHRPPDGLSDEELRAYLLHLHQDTPKAASTLNVAVSGLRFFYQRVLHRPFTHLERNLPRPRQAKRRPKAYTVAEVTRLLQIGCPHPKHRAFLMTVYGAGLRLNEACHLRPEHLDRSAGQIRVEQGKGRKDRYTVLPHRLLRELEAYWRRYRPQGGWLFPSTRGYEFCQRGALEHSGRSCRMDGTGVTLRTCWDANQQVGFREMLEEYDRSHSPFP